MAKIMENPIKMDDLGSFPPIFGGPPMFPSRVPLVPLEAQDSRSAFELSMLLEKQLHSPYSALRCGALGILVKLLLENVTLKVICNLELVFNGKSGLPVSSRVYLLGWVLHGFQPQFRGAIYNIN